MAEAAREQKLTRLLEKTGLGTGLVKGLAGELASGLGISVLRSGRDAATRSPARNEIRVVGADQLVRVHRHTDEASTNAGDTVAAANAAGTIGSTDTDSTIASPTPARHDADCTTIPTLRAVVNADEGWQDAGFFNVRVQRHAAGEQSRVVVRHIDRTGQSDSDQSIRWTGPNLAAAAEWMLGRTVASSAPEIIAAPRHLPCTMHITQVYAFQDPEEIDPHPLDAELVNAGVPIAANTDLTLAIALTLDDPHPQATADDRPARLCRVAVYAKTFPTGAQAEVGAHVLEVNPAMDSWVARVPIKGLAAGKYRMTIAATLEAPYGGIAYREIPLVRVS